MAPLCPTNHSSPLMKSNNEMEAAFCTSSLDTNYGRENLLPVSYMHLAVCKENTWHHLTKHRSEKRKFADVINGEECKSPKRTCRDYTGTSESIAAEDADTALLLKHMKQYFSPSEMIALWHLYVNRSVKTRRLTLVLDLDNTLINSTLLKDLSPEELYLLEHINKVKKEDESLLYKVDVGNENYLVKLRPYVREFLKEVNKMFDLYIYTMGSRAYAREIVKLLDPDNEYFNQKILTRSDCTQRRVKALDVVLGSKTSTIIIDDTRSVWKEDDRENLIEILRYNYFSSSCKIFQAEGKSYAETRSDEEAVDGILDSILCALRCAHRRFFEDGTGNSDMQPDLRTILKKIRGEILEGCEVVFSKVPGWESLWQVAKQLGANCSRNIHSQATHVLDSNFSARNQWAVRNGIFLVHPRWLQAAQYLWRRPREDGFLPPPLHAN